VQFAARSKMLRALAKAYEAMGRLAAYDASTEAESAVTDLSGSINTYATAVGSDTLPISNVVGTIVAIGANGIAGEIQSAKIKKASVLIRQQLLRMQRYQVGRLFRCPCRQRRQVAPIGVQRMRRHPPFDGQVRKEFVDGRRGGCASVSHFNHELRPSLTHRAFAAARATSSTAPPRRWCRGSSRDCATASTGAAWR